MARVWYHTHSIDITSNQIAWASKCASNWNISGLDSERKRSCAQCLSWAWHHDFIDRAYVCIISFIMPIMAFKSHVRVGESPMTFSRWMRSSLESPCVDGFLKMHKQYILRIPSQKAIANVFRDCVPRCVVLFLYSLCASWAEIQHVRWEVISHYPPFHLQQNFMMASPS